jgi:Zn ribbon nucleic-acid-binding protein
MRYFFVLLILFVLPLQWSYAAVANYCQHEEVGAAQNHMGHHAHQHADKTIEDKGKKATFADLDCPNCQHSTSAAMMMQLPTIPVPHFSAVPCIFRNQSIPHRSPDNPFRPPLAICL